MKLNTGNYVNLEKKSEFDKIIYKIKKIFKSLN